MAFRRGRAWLRGLVVPLVLGVLLGAAPPSTADDGRPPGAAEGVDLSKKYENPLMSPLLHPVFELRLELARVLGEKRAHLAFDQYRNGASDLIDPRKLNKQQREGLLKGSVSSRTSPTWRGKMIDLESVGSFLNRKDLAELRHDNQSNVLALSALNIRGTQHSEGVIQNLLDDFDVAKSAKLAGASERQQCWECANFYHPETPTFFGVPFDLNTSEVEALDRGILTIEKEWKAKGASPKAINRRVDRWLAEWEGRTEDRNKQAADRLKTYLGDAKNKAGAAASKNAGVLSSTFSASKPCDTKPAPQKSQAPGVPAQGFMRLAAAGVNPCDKTRPSAESRPATGLGQALTLPGAAPGGIDFSSLQLRYLSDPGDGSGLQYSFSAQRDPMKGDSRPATGVTAADQTSDAFFVWLALNPSAFWVNLNPNEPHRIVDSKLGRTDAGRIMLEADLQMKKTVGKLIHPDSELGRKFWDGITGKCLSQRVWILPEPATVRQDGDKLYIVDAPLDVRMEAQYLAQRGKGSTASCEEQDKASGERNEQLFRSLILPELKRAINTAPEYAEVRRVYLARVAAEWYRELSRTKHTTYGDLIGKGDIDNWQTTSDWKPTDTFNKFVDSYTKGEFNVTHKTTEGNTIYTRTYVYGGVDLKRITFKKVSGDRFQKEHAGLSKNIDKSLTVPSAGDGDNAVWLGAPTPLQASGGTAPEDQLSASGWALRLLPALLLPFAALLWWRRRRLSTSTTASPLRRAAAPRRTTRYDNRRPS